MIPTCLVIAAVVTCQALGPRLSPAEAAQILVSNVSSGVVPVFAPAPESVIVAWTPPVIPTSTAAVPAAIQIPLPWPTRYGAGLYGPGYGGRHRPVRPRVVADRTPVPVVIRQVAPPPAAPVRARAMLATLDR